MKIADSMRTTVYTVKEDAMLHEAMQLMAEHMVGTLPVINDERNLLGVVVMDDVLKRFMPRFVELIRSADFVHDYGVLEAGRKSPQLARLPIKDIMRPPYCVGPNSGLMEAMVMMHKHEMPDVPVVDDKKQVVGLISYARVGSLFLSDWFKHFSNME